MLCYARFTCDIKNKARNSTISIVMNSRSLYTVYERIQRVNKSGRLLYLDVCVKACYAASLCAMQSLKQCSCTVFCSQVIDTITEWFINAVETSRRQVNDTAMTQRLLSVSTTEWLNLLFLQYNSYCSHRICSHWWKFIFKKDNNWSFSTQAHSRKTLSNQYNPSLFQALSP